MDFERLDEIARGLMLGRRSHVEREVGHVYYHGVRTMRGVTELRRRVTADGSHDELLRAAALFHDCGKRLEPYERSGALLAGEFLRDALTPGELGEVTRLISRHDLRGHADDDMWVKLLQDADLIDHYGTMEIWLNIFYNAYHDIPVQDAVRFYREEYPRQAQHHRALLNFDAARRIFDEKLAFTLRFVDRLALEGAGGYALEQEPAHDCTAKKGLIGRLTPACKWSIIKLQSTLQNMHRGECSNEPDI